MASDGEGASEEWSYEQLRRRRDAPAGSAWGVFGETDELGTVNRLTPERAGDAAHGVRRGAVFNLDVALDAFDEPLVASRRLPQHTIFQRNAFHRDNYLDSFYLQGWWSGRRWWSGRPAIPPSRAARTHRTGTQAWGRA